MKKSCSKGFTLIELLVVIAIISLLSSVIAASLSTTRKKARDSQRIQNARQIAIALEQYEATYNTYKVANSGLGSNGNGYVAKSGGSYSSNSILSTLKAAGLYTNTNLADPVFGDNYYLGLCTSTNAYNVFVKMEQSEYNNSTTSISNTCGGAEAAALGFNFIASTAGGASGGGGGGSGYSGVSDPIICGSSTLIGQDSLIYGTVLGEDGRCWLDRNLGATRVATAYNDIQSYGHYYQWGRGYDGHQIPTSGTTSALSSSDIPGHGYFIINNLVDNDWRSSINNSLWQGVGGINNICPSGFRLPTTIEFQTLAASIPNFSTATCGGSNNCRNVGYNSILKITAAGYRSYSNAGVYNLGFNGSYWSSSPFFKHAHTLFFTGSDVGPASMDPRAYGFTVRCIKD